MGNLDAIAAVFGGCGVAVLGWFTARLVSQVDKEIEAVASHTREHCEEIAALDKRISLLEARGSGHR